MKARPVLPVFASLLLMASLAFAAAPPAGDGAAEAVGPMSAAVPADESPACNPLLAKLEISAGSTAQNAATITCGACSQTICQGAVLGSICQGGTQVKKCTWVYGDECPVDSKPRCLCWSGPLP
jgi:hypothetical protein